MVLVMVDTYSTAFKMELKEDPKTSTWFKDHISVFEELMAEYSKILEGDHKCFNRTDYHPYILGVIDRISGKVTMSSIFLIVTFSLFSANHFSNSKDCLFME